MTISRPVATLLAVLFATTSVHAATPDAQARADEPAFRALYKELVETKVKLEQRLTA